LCKYADLRQYAQHCCRSAPICPVLLQIGTDSSCFVQICIGFFRSALICTALMQIHADLPYAGPDLHLPLLFCANMHLFLQICANMHSIGADPCWSALCWWRSALTLAVLCKYTLVSAHLH
jgi:hypothetical protein